jgi:hypothetical protein
MQDVPAEITANRFAVFSKMWLRLADAPARRWIKQRTAPRG